MKILAKKVVFPLLIFMIVSYLSKYRTFPFMAYSFLPSKNIFTFLAIIFIIILCYSKSLVSLSIDGEYLYRLHFLLLVIWTFLFFLYHEYLISLLTLIFSFIVTIMLTFHMYNFRKILLFNMIIYMLYHVYIIIINILIL